MTENNKRRFEGEWVKLGDVCEIVNGYAFKSKNYVSEGIRIIRIANVQKGYLEDSNPCYYPLSSNEDIERFALEKNDLLLSLTGNVGRVALLPDNMLPAALNQRVACLRVKVAEDFDKNYLFHILNSSKFEQDCISSAKGLAQKNLSTNWVKEYAIPCPPIEVQREISCLIRKVSSMIEESNSLLLRLDDLVKSRFNEMFGSYIGSCTLTRYIQSLVAGKSLAGDSECLNLVLKTGAVSRNIFDGTQVKYLPADYVPRPEHLVESGDVIISRMNTSELVACAGYVWAINDNVYLPDRLWKAIPSNDTNPIFLWQLLIQPEIRRAISKAASGTSGSMKNISKKALLNTKVPDININLQQQFADFVAQVDKLRFDVQQQIEKLETLKQSLMQEYFG